MDSHAANSGYDVPTYDTSPDTCWYHFLHGNVPGHQIDFIFRPAVPQGELTRQHFSHFGRLVTYIEPRHESAYAFAIGNLSRDDTQYEPGHGGVALMFALRIKGAVDHAGRQDPPFCHSIACVDRQVDETGFYEAALRFHEHLVTNPESPTGGSRWYPTYVSTAQQSRESARPLIQEYLQGFDKLPALAPSALGLRWSVEGGQAPKRVVIVHPNDTPFEVLARMAARIASVLFESDIRWTAISTGREQDLIGGTTVRFVPERDAVQEPADVVLMHIDQVPAEPREMAAKLFGAHEVRISQTQELRLKWRHMKADKEGASGSPAQVATAPIATAETGSARPWAKTAEAEPTKGASDNDAQSANEPIAKPEGKNKQRRQFMMMVVLGVAIAIGGLLIAVWFALAPTRVDNAIAPRASTRTTPATVSATPPPTPAESSVSTAPAPSATASEAVPVPSAATSAMPTATTSSTAPVKKAGTTKKGGDLIGGTLRDKSR